MTEVFFIVVVFYFGFKKRLVESSRWKSFGTGRQNGNQRMVSSDGNHSNKIGAIYYPLNVVLVLCTMTYYNVVVPGTYIQKMYGTGYMKKRRRLIKYEFSSEPNIHVL